jgi:hypothetical protein
MTTVGQAGPLLFLLVQFVLPRLDPTYDWLGRSISELALGPLGSWPGVPARRPSGPGRHFS